MKSRTLLQAAIGSTITIILLLFMTECGKDSATKGRNMGDRSNDQIDLDQAVTVKERPTDSLYANFSKFWPTMINRAQELTLPVIPLKDDEQKEEPWNPRVSSDCVFSEAAGIVVPVVTLTWAEPAANSERMPMRTDLTVHYQGFERNLYTTVYPIEPLTRFNIPGNSEFLRDTAAVLLTGTTLFPKLRGYEVNMLQNKGNTGNNAQQNEVQQAASVTYQVYSVTLSDLSPGLSYTIRLCDLEGKDWRETKSFVFTTPICKNKF